LELHVFGVRAPDRTIEASNRPERDLRTATTLPLQACRRLREGFLTRLYTRSRSFRLIAASPVPVQSASTARLARWHREKDAIMSIGWVGGNGTTNQGQGTAATQRPDPAQLAQKLFQQLDTSGQGYLSKSDLQAALDKVTLSKEGLAASSASAASDTGSSADALMAKLDSNGDGKISEQEFTDALSSAAQQMRGHGGHHHAHGAHGGRSANGGDHDGDGDDAAPAAATSSASTSTSTTDTDTDTHIDSGRALLQVMRMVRAYQVSNDPAATSQTATTTQGAATQGVSAAA
jgi:hypothetical protein